MASKTFSGQLDQAMNEAAAEGNKILFIPQQTVGEVLPGAASELVVESDGSYSITLAYNTYSIYHYSDVTKRKTLIAIDVVVSVDTSVSTIPDLIGSTVPVTEDSVLTIQGYLTDAQDSATAAATSESNAAASEAAVTNRVAAYEVESTDYLINTFDGSSLSTGDVVRTLGYYSAGDGGGADWVVTGETGTASQSPADNGDYYLNDSIGNEFKLDTANRVELIRLGFGSLTNAENTALVQGLIDNHYQDISGIEIVSPDGEYYFSSSTLTDYYLNESGELSLFAGDAVLNVRANCSLTGSGRDSVKWIADEVLTFAWLVEPSYTRISGIHFDGGYSDSGAGHGLFVAVNDLNADVYNLEISSVRVTNVGSYGVGINYGYLEGCIINDVDISDTGADGVDIKTRSEDGRVGEMNRISNVNVRRFGTRLGGTAGVDIRGIWQVSNIIITDFGDQDEVLTKVGFRLRPESTEAANNVSNFCLCTNIYVEGNLNETDDSTLSTNDAGIQMSGYGNVLVGFVSRNCQYGLTSNSAEVVKASHGVIEGHGTYGYYSTVTGDHVSLTDVRFQNANGATHHLRIEGDYHNSRGVTYDESASGYSVATVANPTLSRDYPSTEGAEYLDFYSSTGRVTLQAKGETDDIDLALVPNGSGKLRYGSHSTVSSETITGYIEIKDSSGATRKLAVIS